MICLDLVVKGPKEEISKAFTLCYFGKRGYIYLRQKRKYLLLGITSLQSWASNVNLRKGILKYIFRIMDIWTTKTMMQKLSVLSYDEMKDMEVSSIYEFNQ